MPDNGIPQSEIVLQSGKTVGQFISERRFLLLLLPCLVTLLSLYAVRWEWVRSIDRFAVDGYFRARGAYAPVDIAENFSHTRRIVLVEINHPLPRQMLARVLRQLREAKVVAVDLMLVDHEAELGALEKKHGWYEEEIQRWHNDNLLLARAIRESGNVVLGAWLEEVSVKSEPRVTKGAVVAPRMQLRYFWQHPRDILWWSARHRAHLSVEPEGGVVRRVRLLQDTTGDTGLTPSLGLAAVAAYLNTPIIMPDGDEQNAGRHNFLRVGDRNIPLDEEGRIWIDYQGGRDSFSYVSNRVDYAEVLNFYEPADFRDNIVIVGESSLKSKDVARTPFGEVAGMQIHANVIASLLHPDGPPRSYPLGKTVALTLLCSILLGLLLLLRWPPWANLLGMLCEVVLLIALGVWLFIEHRQVLQISPPLLAIALTYNIMALYEYQRTRQMLSVFVGHDMFRRMLGRASPLQLGGAVEDACACFCDLRGFSKLASLLPPALTSDILNEYTTLLVQTVRRYGGRPVSFQGDGVFVLFEQSLAGTNYSEKAVLASLEFLRKFRKLQKKWEDEGVAQLEVGVGIASGPMMIGLVGAEDHMKPDAIGDPVNVASRLQGLSDETGYNILISEDIHAQVRDAIPTIYCGSHTVRGREEPLEVYTVVQAPSPERAETKENWMEAFRHPYGRWQELTHWPLAGSPAEPAETEGAEKSDAFSQSRQNPS